MNLKNYTSSVPAETSMAAIQKALVAGGATDISMKYKDKICVAITFRMELRGKEFFFKLPARVDRCFEVFWAEVKRPRPDTKAKTMKQAEMTAWKILRDWVDVQISMVALEQAEPFEIFLPYVYNPATDETFYEKLKGQDFKLLK